MLITIIHGCHYCYYYSYSSTSGRANAGREKSALEETRGRGPQKRAVRRHSSILVYISLTAAVERIIATLTNGFTITAGSRTRAYAMAAVEVGRKVSNRRLITVVAVPSSLYL